MALVVVNGGEDFLLQYAFNKTTPVNFKLKLYTSNTTPAETDTAGTYTEATFTGYAAITLTRTSWTITPGAPTSASYAQQTFTCSGSAQNQTVYGYFVTNASDVLLWAERFDSSVLIKNNGDNIKLTPAFTLD